MRIQKKNCGFSLLELIITIAILSVLTGVLALSVTRSYRSAKEDMYVVEARHVFDVAAMYLLDREIDGITGDQFEMTIRLMQPLNKKNHVLKPYLEGNFRKDAYIRSLEFDGSIGMLISIEYAVDGYVIEVDQSKDYRFLERP